MKIIPNTGTKEKFEAKPEVLVPHIKIRVYIDEGIVRRVERTCQEGYECWTCPWRGACDNLVKKLFEAEV